MRFAQGKGFSNVFRTETGPTAWLAPVYPLIVAATFKLFGTFTARAFFACAGAEHTFFFGGLCADFLCGKTDRRIGSRGGGGVALGGFS